MTIYTVLSSLRLPRVAALSSGRMKPTDSVNDEQPQDTQEGGQQPQDARQDDTKSPLMDLYSCNHGIAPALKERLVDREACPECLVDYHIKVIEDLQDVLDQRGGIFLSKTSDPADESIIPHKDCIRLWTVVKVECYQDIGLLETICRDDPQQGERWGIPKALQRWYQKLPHLARVPGSRDALQDQIETWQQGGPEPDLTVGHSSDMRQSIEHVQNLYMKENEISLQDKKGPTQSSIETTSSPTDQESTSTKRDAPEDAQEGTPQLDLNKSLEDWVIFDAAANRSTPPDAPLTPTSPPATPRSVLKGSRPTTPVSRPRTSFAEHTTIIAPKFRYSGSTDHRPHNKHTSADEARRQPHFHRPSATYEPATWSSPEGHEKDNTSHYKTSWYKYEMVMEIGKWEKKAPAVKRNPLLPDARTLAAKVREAEDWLLAKNRAKARKREQLIAKHGRKGEEQGESSKAIEGPGEDDGDGDAAEQTEGNAGHMYSALDAGVGESESER